MHGTLGIGCISDYEAQPILVRSHHGTFAITTIGKINNANEIVEDIIGRGTHFFEMQNGEVNPTELVAAIIDQKENFIDGIRYAQEVVNGSLSMLVLTRAAFTRHAINSAAPLSCSAKRKTATAQALKASRI